MDLSVVVPIQESILTDRYCTLSAVALLLFEYALTLDREVALFWKRKATGASVLFLSNRYLSLVAYCTRIFLMGHWPCSSYADLEIASQVFAFLQYVPWAAFSALRVYALCGRTYRWPLSMLVLALSSLLIVVNYLRLHWLTPVEDTIVTGAECVMREVRVPPGLNRTFTIVPRVGVIVADAIVLVVTWRTTYRSNSVLRSALARPTGGRKTFASTLLRDGTIYFGSVYARRCLRSALTTSLTLDSLLFIMNVIYLTLTMYPTEVDSLTQVSYVVEFSEPLTTILISRFLLNLQEVNRNLDLDVSSSTTARARTWTRTPPSLDTVVFADRVVGPMGHPLSLIDGDGDDDDDDDDNFDSEYAFDFRRSDEYGYPMTPATRRRKWAV